MKLDKEYKDTTVGFKTYMTQKDDIQDPGID